MQKFINELCLIKTGNNIKSLKSMSIQRHFTVLQPAFSSLFILLVLMTSGCTKSSELTLVGTYTRNVIIDEQAWEVNLMLTDDGYLRWIPVDSIPGHTASEARVMGLRPHPEKRPIRAPLRAT